jgi:PhnB protein
VTRPRGLSPHLFVRDADTAVGFYAEAFGAAELLRSTLPDGTLLFVELAVGPARLLVSEETPSLGALAPPTVGGTPMLLLLEVDDPDNVARRAVWAGAEVEMPVRRCSSASATASSATRSGTAGRCRPRASS